MLRDACADAARQRKRIHGSIGGRGRGIRPRHAAGAQRSERSAMKTIAWICLVITAACAVSGPVLDPDLWWHIVVGRWIIAHEAFPVVDYWNLFGVSTPWRAYSWLFEVVVALIDARFGDHGLLIAQILLLAMICAALSCTYRSLARNWFAGTWLGVLVTFGMTQHYGLRPQSVVWALEAAVIAMAFSIADRGISRRKLLALVLVMCLWANLHITTAVGLGILACVLIGAVALPVAARVLAAGLLGTLLTPYLGAEWLIFVGAAGQVRDLSSIVELQPATILEVPTLFLVLMTFLVGIAATRHRRSWPPLLLVGSAVMVFAGLAVTKFLPMALVLLAAIVARSLRPSLTAGDQPGGAWDGVREVLRQIEALWRKVSPAVQVPALLVASGLFFVLLWREPVLRSAMAVELVDRVVKEDLPQPVLNDFGRGGYLMYRYADGDGVPRHLVPIDGRSNVIPPERMTQYMDMAAGAGSWREFFDAVDPRTVVFQVDSPLVAILEATGNWCVIGRVSGVPLETALLLRKDEFERRRHSAAPVAAENCL
jgi:hypothetical protein